MVLAAQDRAADEGRIARIFHAGDVVRAGLATFSISAASPPVFLAHGLEVGRPCYLALLGGGRSQDRTCLSIQIP
jgi:hypothetical protein